MSTFYAQPYDISANGFYFENVEEYRDRIACAVNAHGQPVEEFEIQFIDGDDIDAALPEARVLAMMRAQRADMAVKQSFGNLINKLVLDGVSPDGIARYFPDPAARIASAYAKDLGDAAIQQKIRDVGDRLKFLID